MLKNTAVKIVHRLPAKDDRDTVGATMNLTEDQSRYLVTLVPGEAAVFTDGMDYPVLARMPDGTSRETSAAIRPGSVTALVTGRSTACPADCGAAPCALGQIATAQRTLERDPAITLWAEFTVAAHLAGWPSPSPGSTVLDRLTAMNPRQRDCTLARAIDDAVAARIPAISSRVAGPALAAHIAHAIRSVLDDNRWPCTDHEPQWLAPACAWAPLTGELRSYADQNEDIGPHPGTADLEALYGRAIPGGTCADQAKTVSRWDDAARRTSPPLRDVLLGTRTPSAIETAARTWAHDPDFAGHLAAELAGFPDGDWYASQIAAATGAVAP